MSELNIVYEEQGPASSNNEDTENKPDTYLAVPISRGLKKLGALLLQRKNRKHFSDEDIKDIKVISTQLANIMENSDLMLFLNSIKDKKITGSFKENLIKGKAASDGFYYSEIFVFDRIKPFEYIRKMKFDKTYTLKDFLNAVNLTENDLVELQKKIENEFSSASLIFGAYIVILKDPTFTGEIIKHIERGRTLPRH